jgi:hypothetical protein
MEDVKYEERARVKLFLPHNNYKERNAINEILTHLQSRRRIKGRLIIEGFTQSSVLPITFLGYWWSSRRRKWIRDKIVLIIIDYWLTLTVDTSELEKEIADLRDKIFENYEKYGAKQESLWITAQSIQRYD